MVSLNHVEEQLKRVGCNFRFWGRPEIRELCKILLPEEIIAQCVNGRYEGGFALLVVTDHRLLLIDRRPMFLTLEDIRFDMISEIDYSARLMDGTVHIITPNRKLSFTSWGQVRMRKLLDYTQQRVMEIRQHFMLQQLQAARDVAPQISPSMVGNLAMQPNGGLPGNGSFNPRLNPNLPANPYTKMPLLLRSRKYPKFYQG